MASLGRRLGRRVLVAVVVLVLATSVGAEQRWTADVVVGLYGGGQHVLPDRDAARSGARLPPPRVATANALHFTFDSPDAPWSAEEREMLARVLGDCYPVVGEIYGEPAFDNTVNVRRDP